MAKIAIIVLYVWLGLITIIGIVRNNKTNEKPEPRKQLYFYLEANCAGDTVYFEPICGFIKTDNEVAVCEKVEDLLPLGYTLEKNQYGEYRPLRNGSELFWINGLGTRKEAIERAWRQYKFEQKEASYKWEKVRNAR